MPIYFLPSVSTALAFGFGVPGLPLTPSESRIPYDWRSPLSYAADLQARTDVKLLVLQGNADALIEPSQACALAATDTSFTKFHVKSWGSCDPTSMPSDCLSGTCTAVAPGVGQCTCTKDMDCQGPGGLMGNCLIPLGQSTGACTCTGSSQCGSGGVCLDGGICVATVGGAPGGADPSQMATVGCGQFGLTWPAGAPLPIQNWSSSSRHLVVVDGANHGSILFGSPGLTIFASWVQSNFP
jgi:hypothetical protein